MAKEREIKLDPMEWRDAMKDVKKPKPATAKKKTRPAAGGKRAK